MKTLSILIIYYSHKLFSLVEDHDGIQHNLYAPGALEDYTEYCKIRQSFELENSKGVMDDYYEIFYRSIWLRAVLLLISNPCTGVYNMIHI